jgi:hypothetical protein
MRCAHAHRKRKRYLSITTSLVCVLLAALWLTRYPRIARAQNNGWVTQELGNSSGGGMAVYGSEELSSTSASSDLQVMTNWNNYINARCGWSLSSPELSTLANADYSARSAGQPTITAQQLANAANYLINSTLSTMSASQQEALFEANAYVSVPNGTIYVNSPDPNVSATQNSNGTWTVTVSASEFSQRKSFFQTYAPGMVSSYSNFYPGEALMVTYSLASGDMGYDNNYQSSTIQFVENATGAYVQLLFGSNGYFIRRPLPTFLTTANIDQFFSNLGF